VGAALQQEFALVGDDHFGGPAAADGQGLDLMDYLSSRSRRMTRKNAEATALKTNTAIR
jgi:hypothetical protein